VTIRTREGSSSPTVFPPVPVCSSTPSKKSFGFLVERPTSFESTRRPHCQKSKSICNQGQECYELEYCRKIVKKTTEPYSGLNGNQGLSSGAYRKYPQFDDVRQCAKTYFVVGERTPPQDFHKRAPILQATDLRLRTGPCGPIRVFRVALFLIVTTHYSPSASRDSCPIRRKLSGCGTSFSCNHQQLRGRLSPSTASSILRCRPSSEPSALRQGRRDASGSAHRRRSPAQSLTFLLTLLGFFSSTSNTILALAWFRC